MWATWFHAATKDPLLLMIEGGWKSIARVERYAHLMPSAMGRDIRTIWGGSHPRIGAFPDGAESANHVQGPIAGTKGIK